MSTRRPTGILGDMTEPDVLTDIDGHVATISINRPAKRNSLDMPAARALRDAIDEMAGNKSVRALILTGAGGYFCAGDDTAVIAETGESQDVALDANTVWNAFIVRLANFPVPVIAAMEGVAAGAGLSIAMACDIRIAATNIKIFTPFVRFAVSADTAITYTMLAVAGLDRASLLLYTGERIDGVKAADMRIVTEAVPPEQVLPRAREIAQRIAGNAPLAVAATRQLLKRKFLPGLDEHFPADLEAVMRTLTTSDTAEAMAAYLERREPRFEGR